MCVHLQRIFQRGFNQNFNADQDIQSIFDNRILSSF